MQFRAAEYDFEILSIAGIVGREIQRRTLAVHARASYLCPVKTGRLRSSIRFRMDIDPRGPFGLVSTDVEYAIYVEKGTRAHKILPKNGKALYWKGAAHPVASVNHPGTEAQHFLTNALEAAA